MKTEEELNALKEEVEALNAKLCDLTEDEFAQVSGGNEIETIYTCSFCGKQFTSFTDYTRHGRLHIIVVP